MPSGSPRIGNPEIYGRETPGPEILGTIPNSSKLTEVSDERKGSTTTWTREDGTVVELTEPPPPWEQAEAGYKQSDARRFIECPPNWRLHWINPRLLDSEGWRDWQAVMASDQRVKVKVPTMVTPEGYIRRGGPSGDILAWMWQGWYESVRKRTQRETAERAQSAVDRQRQLKEEFDRGKFGPYVGLEQVRHPRYTQAEIKNPTD